MKTQKWHTKWKKLSWQQKRLYIRLLKPDGHSDKVIGDFFGVSKGTIVGYRQRHLPFLTHGPKATKLIVDPERFQELLEAEEQRRKSRRKPRKRAAQPIAVLAQPVREATPPEEIPKEDASHPPVSTKLGDWREQCQFSGGCGYKRLPGSTSCGRPGHDK